MTIDESSRPSLQPLQTQRLEALFRGLPTLRGVAQISAQAYLDRHFAERRLAARLISIRTPDEASRQHLADWLLKRLATAAPVQLVDGYHSAAQWVREVYLPVALSLGELEALINQCGARLLKDFAEHLQAYWREVGVDNVSRWGHVSRELRALLPADQPSQRLAAPVPGDPFDALSASFLADQLRAIAEIDCWVPRTASDYQVMLDYILAPRRWFASPLSPVQATLQAELPVWLAHAGVEDSLAYARLLQALARQATNTGHFLDGIGSIREFAEARLTACLKDYPFKPSEVQLHFERVIAAAVPVPGGFIAGQVEPITVNLIDLALENLSGFPFEPKAILVNGQLAPAGVTYAQLKTCVTNADVGQAYPALLKSKLLDDPAEAARRGRLFSEQLRIQLPMLALEMKIKGLNGLTEVGVQRAQAMTLWPLAFQAAPAAKADTVAAMFILGTVDSEAGPHLLYRPLFTPMLQEFPSLDALFDAIKTPGELHDQVLAWLAPARQAVYANGGFQSPHIRRFLQGDEFTRYEPPAPARLSKQLATEAPEHQVFIATANALITLADRQSVSNAEQRWATLKQGGWLLLGMLLPYLRGPSLLGGWLVQVMSSAQTAVGQDEPAAFMDLLVNLATVLAHQASPLEPARLAREPALRDFTPIRWANARDQLTPDLFARIQRLVLPTPFGPLPIAESSGRWQGLFHAGDRWLAQVRGEWFRVRIEHDRARVISADGANPGPWLKRQGQGRWDFDLQLRLAGGGDTASDPALQVARRQALEQAYRQAGLDRARASVAMEVARNLAHQPAERINEQQRAQVQARYIKQAQETLDFSLLELQALKQLRELGPRPRYEEDLCRALESVILTTRLLDSHARTQTLAINQRIRPLFDTLSGTEGGGPLDPQAHVTLGQGMRELAAIHEQAIHWRILEQRHLKALEQVPKYGRDKARALNADLPARPSIFDLQSLQLSTLWGIAIDVPGPPLDDDFFASMNLTVNRARWASRSQAELENLPVEASERMEVLDSIDHVYAQTDDQIEFWRAMAPEKFDLAYLDKLQYLLAGLHRQVEKQLTVLLQPEHEGAVEVAAQPSRRKKIIRTRQRDLWVVQSAPSGEQGAERASVHDADGQLIGTFTQDEDGVWDLEHSSPSPVADAELGSLLKKGKALLTGVDKAIANVEAMVGKANDPASLQELLDAQARSRQWAADSLGRKLASIEVGRLASVQLANARAVRSQLNAAVARLQAAGLEARVRATLARAVSQEDVAFLHSQHVVRIIRQGARVALKGRCDDFLQAYRVEDAHTGKAVCFAHFHYARSQGPDDHFTAAHLKSPEQERLGRQAQAQVEAAAFERMRRGQTGRVRQTLEIRRSQIQLPLARRLFFSAEE